RGRLVGVASTTRRWKRSISTSPRGPSVCGTSRIRSATTGGSCRPTERDELGALPSPLVVDSPLMIDLRQIRQEPDVVKAALAKRDPVHGDAIDRVLALDEERRAGLGEVNDLKAERNVSSKRIGELKRAGEDATELVAEMRAVGDRIDEIDAR